MIRFDREWAVSASVFIAFALILGWLISGCDALIGPATKLDDSYFFPCGDVKCRHGWEECSTGKPHRCIPAWNGVARDGGAE